MCVCCVYAQASRAILYACERSSESRAADAARVRDCPLHENVRWELTADGPSFPTRVPLSTILYGETGY